MGAGWPILGLVGLGTAGEGPGEGPESGGDGVRFLKTKMYLVGSTSIGQKSDPPVNCVFRWSILRIMTFWAQIWIRLDLTFPMVKKYLKNS